MQEFLEIPWVITVGWMFGVAGWIVGFSSGLIQFKSYAEQRDMEKGYIAVLEQAKRDWQGKYTEEQIAILSQEVAALEEKIDRDIPNQARRIFLENQLDDLSKSIGQSYLQYSQLINELDDNTSLDTQLSPELKDAIEKTVMPQYLADKRDNKRLQQLIGVALLLLIFVNWDFFMAILPDWTFYRSSVSYFDNYYGSGNYPISWLIVFFVVAIVIAWGLNKTALGTWLNNEMIKLSSSLRTEEYTRSARARVRAFLPVMFLYVSILIVPFLIKFYTDFTMGIATGEYGSPVSMPLDAVPSTVIIAVPMSLCFMFFFYFINIYKNRHKVSKVNFEASNED